MPSQSDKRKKLFSLRRLISLLPALVSICFLLLSPATIQVFAAPSDRVREVYQSMALDCAKALEDSAGYEREYLSKLDFLLQNIPNSQSTIVAMNPRFLRSDSEKNIDMFSDEEARQHRIFFKNGFVYDADGVTLYDTSDGTEKSLSNTSVESTGIALFGVNIWGETIAIKDVIVNKRHHSTVLAGRPGRMLGQLRAIKGRLTYLDNRSGHYRPPPRVARLFLENLKQEHFDLLDLELRMFDTNSLELEQAETADLALEVIEPMLLKSGTYKIRFQAAESLARPLYDENWRWTSKQQNNFSLSAMVVRERLLYLSYQKEFARDPYAEIVRVLKLALKSICRTMRMPRVGLSTVQIQYLQELDQLPESVWILKHTDQRCNEWID